MYQLFPASMASISKQAGGDVLGAMIVANKRNGSSWVSTADLPYSTHDWGGALEIEVRIGTKLPIMRYAKRTWANPALQLHLMRWWGLASRASLHRTPHALELTNGISCPNIQLTACTPTTEDSKVPFRYGRSQLPRTERRVEAIRSHVENFIIVRLAR